MNRIAVNQGVQLLRPYLDDLQSRLLATGPDGAEKALADWKAAHLGDNALGAMITRPTLLADLAGQIMVARYETKRLGREAMAFKAEEPPPAFLNLPFPEAIELYRKMDIPRQREFAQLIEDYSARNGKAAGLMLERIRAESLRLINRAMDEGTDYRDYIENMQQFINDLGVGDEHPAYLENVFRTNTATAYGAGRYRQLTDPDVLAEFPYSQYRTRGDSRVRESHRILDGLIFRTDNAAFARIMPPNGYQCRCSVVMYEPKKGERIARKVPTLYDPDPDFDQAPDALVRL